MKFSDVESTIKNQENESNWQRFVFRPLLIGIAFGAGCYVAKVILKSPLMINIVDKTVESAQHKIDKIKL